MSRPMPSTTARRVTGQPPGGLGAHHGGVADLGAHHGGVADLGAHHGGVADLGATGVASQRVDVDMDMDRH